MKEKDIWIIALVIGGLYLFSKSTSGSAILYPSGPGGTSPTTAAGGLISALSNLFHPSTIPVATASNPAVSNIPTPTSTTSSVIASGGTVGTTINPSGCAPNGNVCDPNDCDYDEQLCAEMYPNG